MIYDSSVAVVKLWRCATCLVTSPLSSAHLHSTLGPEPTEQQSPAETQKTERQRLRQRQRRDKQRECEIYLQPLGCWPGCCCCNILNLTGKAWCWSDSSCWCTVERRDRSYTHTLTPSFLSCCSAPKSQTFQDFWMLYLNPEVSLICGNWCCTMAEEVFQQVLQVKCVTHCNCPLEPRI